MSNDYMFTFSVIPKGFLSYLGSSDSYQKSGSLLPQGWQS